MEQFQPHNSIDPSLPAPTFFSTTTSAASGEQPAISELPPMVNFTPAQPPIPNQTSYDGMIMAAISALREKDGSSRQAIARYIDRVYNNLPPNHSDLLTHNLKRLKNSGQITMVKHSYMLPSSGSTLPPPSAPPLFTTTSTTPSYSFSPPPAASAPPPPQFMAPPPASAPQFVAFPPQFMLNNMAAPPPPSFPATTLTDAVATSGPPPPPSQPKKRGRPPKPKTDLAPNGPVQAQYQPNGPELTQNVVGPAGSVQNASDGPVEVLSKRKPGRPRKEKSIQAQFTLPTGEAQTATSLPTQPPAAAQNYPVAGAGAGAPVVGQGNGSVSGSEAMLVSLGLSDGPSPAKMRPRRSQKPTNSAPMQPAGVAQNGAKKRGRPRKVNPAVAPPAPGVYPVHVPVETSPPPSNRGRGRPRKYAVAPGAMANGVVNGMQPKKRGRKPKNANQAAAFAVPVSFVLPEQMNAGGGSMMPQTIYVQTGGDASAAVGPGQVPITGGYNGVAYSPMKRGRGRPPRTDGGGPRKARKLTGRPLGRPRKNHSGSEEQSIEIVTLKGKIVYLQSKIKEAVPVIKAYLNGEEANAMGALGELEELAIADLSAPVNVKTQQQPPVQQMPAEQQ